jgi:hypothetical protein
MNYIYTDSTAWDDFAVNNPSTGALVGGLSQGDFTVQIYDPDGLERSGDITWSISEKYPSSGYYIIEFEVDKEGDWLISVIHSTYFPWGKSRNYTVVASTFFSGDSAGGSITTDELLVFILGLY